MVKRVAGYWIAEGKWGGFGAFTDLEVARRAEESWWASPANVTYQEWIERHEKLMANREPGQRCVYPRWNIKQIRWETIAKTMRQLKKAGGWDGLSLEDRDKWRRKLEAEAARNGKVKVEREDIPLDEHLERAHAAQLARSRRYQALRREGLRKGRSDRTPGRTRGPAT